MGGYFQNLEIISISVARPAPDAADAWNDRFAPILLQKSAYRRRGTADTIF
jgi:hypothetical protein